MILSELVGDEHHPAYQALAVKNGERHYDFLRSIVQVSLMVGRPCLSTAIIKALNYHAIACLHVSAGEYRPCPVTVGKPPDQYIPPEHYRVQALMDDMVNMVNRSWDGTDALKLATLVLWQMNAIHPFINGNGRTARAACYFVLCVKANGWLPGKTILPELLKIRERARYVAALKHADKTATTGAIELQPLHDLIAELLREQLASAAPPQPAEPAN